MVSGQVLRGKSFATWVCESLAPLNPEIHRYRGGELGSSGAIDRMVQQIAQPSLFSPFLIAIVSEAEALKVAAVRSLSEIAEKSRRHCLVLCLAAEGKDALAELANGGTVVQLADLQGAALERWIDKEVKQQGGSGIEPRAANLLAQSLSTNLMQLQEELKKLTLTTPSGSPITLETVRSTSVLHTEHDSFELVSSLAKRQALQTAALCRRLVDQGLHPLQIVSFLSKCFRTLLAHKDTSAEAIKALHKDLNNYYFWKGLAPLAPLFSRADLVQTLQTLHDLDSRLKLSGLEAELSLSISMHRISSRSFKTSRNALRG